MTTDAMVEFPKINTLWKRDDRGRVIVGDYSEPEFEFLADRPWIWTEKVDGTNIRIGRPPLWSSKNADPLPYWIRGRTDNAMIPPRLLAHLVPLWQSLPWSATFPTLDAMSHVTLYGEGYGAGIQKGGMYRPDPSFVLFDVQVGSWWLQRSDVEDVAANLDVDVVPVVATATIAEAVELVRSGFDSAWPGARPEGLVGRPAVDLWGRKGQRITTKIKAKDLARTPPQG